jgi:exodeoxyribonuclease VII small subunit
MSETDPTQTDGEIGTKMDRIQEIIDQLEDGELSVERAKHLHDEGKELLADVEDELDLGEASVIDRE